MSLLFGMRKLLVFGILLPLSSLAVSGAVEEDDGKQTELTINWKNPLNCLGLVPNEDSHYGASGPERLSKQLGRNLTQEELSAFKAGSEGPWREFSDELVRFQVPDHALLNVEPFTREEDPQLRVVGGAVGTTDNSFQRVYRFTVGPDKIPYGLLFVTKADWFDDGICLCGPIVLKVFTEEKGTLLELSQLPGGDLKKFQILNDTHRGILFEWTHSAIPQETYARIGGSLRFQEPSKRTVADWRELVSLKRGLSGRLGFLRPGMSKEKALELLGEWQKTHEESYTFHQDEFYEDQSGSRSIYEISFKGEKLVQFGENWSRREDILAPKGTLSWCRSVLNEGNNDPFGDEESEGPSKEVKEEVLKSFLANAPKATVEWSGWCQILNDLAEDGVRSVDALALVEARILEMELDHGSTYWVLEEYESEKQEEFLLARLRYLLDFKEKEEFRHGEEHNLFVLLNNLAHDDDELRPTAEEIIREGLIHPSESMRASAYYILDFLPKDEAHEFLIKGLSDPSKEVRRNASYDISSLCSIADKDWLNDVLSFENDKWVKRQLEEEIKTLK